MIGNVVRYLLWDDFLIDDAFISIKKMMKNEVFVSCCAFWLEGRGVVFALSNKL